MFASRERLDRPQFNWLLPVSLHRQLYVLKRRLLELHDRPTAARAPLAISQQILILIFRHLFPKIPNLSTSLFNRKAPEVSDSRIRHSPFIDWVVPSHLEQLLHHRLLHNQPQQLHELSAHRPSHLEHRAIALHDFSNHLLVELLVVQAQQFPHRVQQQAVVVAQQQVH